VPVAAAVNCTTAPGKSGPAGARVRVAALGGESAKAGAAWRLNTHPNPVNAARLRMIDNPNRHAYRDAGFSPAGKGFHHRVILFIIFLLWM